LYNTLLSGLHQFDPMLFYNPDEEFDIDGAEAKLFALM
jgi:hypothetical protein